jgi:hypothetical protein
MLTSLPPNPGSSHELPGGRAVGPAPTTHSDDRDSQDGSVNRNGSLLPETGAERQKSQERSICLKGSLTERSPPGSGRLSEKPTRPERIAWQTERAASQERGRPQGLRTETGSGQAADPECGGRKRAGRRAEVLRPEASWPQGRSSEAGSELAAGPKFRGRKRAGRRAGMQRQECGGRLQRLQVPDHRITEPEAIGRIRFSPRQIFPAAPRGPAALTRTAPASARRRT